MLLCSHIPAVASPKPVPEHGRKHDEGSQLCGVWGHGHRCDEAPHDLQHPLSHPSLPPHSTPLALYTQSHGGFTCVGGPYVPR